MVKALHVSLRGLTGGAFSTTDSDAGAKSKYGGKLFTIQIFYNLLLPLHTCRYIHFQNDFLGVTGNSRISLSLERGERRANYGRMRFIVADRRATQL